MATYLDTNIIIRFFSADGDDPALFEESCEIMKKIEKGEIHVIISESVFLECLFVLTKIYKFSLTEVIKDMKNILFFSGVDNKEKIIFSTTLDFVLEYKVDFVDALLLAKAKYLGGKVLTFDKKIQKKSV